MKFLRVKTKRVHKVVKPIRQLIREQNEKLRLSQMKSYGRTNPLSTQQSKQFFVQLTNLGFDSYLKTGIGGSKTAKHIRLIIQQTSTFLDWATGYLGNKYNSVDTDILNLLFIMINENSKSIFPFLYYLEMKQYKPMTCYSYIYSLRSACDWLITVHQNQFSNSFPLCLYEFDHVTKMARKKYKQASSRRTNAMNDSDELIQLGRWPENGLADLQLPVLQEMAWANALVIYI